MAKEPKRIPYDSWINSQLSIVRHYGSCTLNGVRYVLDLDNCRTEGKGDDKRYFPDLVEVIEKKVPKKKGEKGTSYEPHRYQSS